MVRLTIYLSVLLILVDMTFAASQDSDEDSSAGKIMKTKKKKRSDKSTSSSSGATTSDSGSGDSLAMSDSSITDSDGSKQKDWPKSSEERHGWRKWHRKCRRCPDDAKKKWKDPTIRWICGAYQRARRSFKSKCMMEYRNCQDGTMFVKIHNFRCANQTGREDYTHGEHFFYEYRVMLSDESASTNSESTESSTHEDSSDW